MPVGKELNLLAAMVACNDGKVDVWKMAAMLDTTFDTVQNRLRKAKQEAQEMVKQATTNGRLDAAGNAIKESLPQPAARAPRGSKSKGATQGVLTGRVIKPGSKGSSKAIVKKEQMDDAMEDASDARQGAESGSEP